jgi:hypothetical protein
MVESPVATLTTIGKNEIRNAVITGRIQPTPNHRIKIGTTATVRDGVEPPEQGLAASIDDPGGAECDGEQEAHGDGEAGHRHPQCVDEWNSSCHQYSIEACAIALGAGRKLGGTLKTRHAPSHSAKKATVNP